MTASTSGERITELNAQITAYGNEGAAASDLKTKVDCADNAIQALEERERPLACQRNDFQMTGNANSGDRRAGGRWAKRVQLGPLEMPQAVHVLLTAAAARRNMLPEDLALGLIGAVLTRGNIEEMLNKWNGYIHAGERVVPRDQYRTTNNNGDPVRPQDPFRGASEIEAQASEE
jgi:hypothetical protein